MSTVIWNHVQLFCHYWTLYIQRVTINQMLKTLRKKKFHLLLNRCRLIFPAMIPKTIVYNNYLHSIYHVLGVIHNARKYMEHMWGLYSDIMLLYYMKDLRITEFSICKRFIESVFRIYCGTIIYTHFLNWLFA